MQPMRPGESGHKKGPPMSIGGPNRRCAAPHPSEGRDLSRFANRFAELGEVVREDGNAAQVRIRQSTISRMPATAKLRLAADFANIADRIRKIRFTPGMAYRISVPIQLRMEGRFFPLLAMMHAPLVWQGPWALSPQTYIHYTCSETPRQTPPGDFEKKSRFCCANTLIPGRAAGNWSTGCAPARRRSGPGDRSARARPPGSTSGSPCRTARGPRRSRE